jgi:hypothetical protein
MRISRGTSWYIAAELDIPPAGGMAGVGDQRRYQGDGVSLDRGRARRDDGRELGGRIEIFRLAHVHGLYYTPHA